jgi:hypothetical protein
LWVVTARLLEEMTKRAILNMAQLRPGPNPN